MVGSDRGRLILPTALLFVLAAFAPIVFSVFQTDDSAAMLFMPSAWFYTLVLLPILLAVVVRVANARIERASK